MGNGFAQKITRIKGLSDQRRLPRLGVIRLGLKAKTARGVEYPTEVSYFVCPDEVRKVYGERPTELDVMIPINEIDSVFPVAYKFYGSSKGLRCSGNGELAYCVNDKKEMEQRECPCENLESGKCKQSGTLMVILPQVSVGGIYQIRTSSFNSIIDVQSGLDYVSALLGRFALVPLKLRRVKTETHHDEKKQNHYTMQIIFDGDIHTLNALRSDTLRVLEHPRYQLPAPLEENPEMDEPDIIDIHDEEPLPEKADTDSQDVPKSNDQGKDTQLPKKELSANRKALEAKMSENGWDRTLFKLWLNDIGKLERVDGTLSMNNLTDDTINKLFAPKTWEWVVKHFNLWIDKRAA